MWTEIEISVEAFQKLYLYCPDKDVSRTFSTFPVILVTAWQFSVSPYNKAI